MTKKRKGKWKPKKKRKAARPIVAPVCSYCGGTAKCEDSREIYGRSYGFAWICPNFPTCNSYVGCHPGTRIPLGRLANAELRKLKIAVHDAFDPIWRSQIMTRRDAYGRLADALGIPFADCHIGMFDESRCQAALLALETIKAELRSATP